MRTRVPLRLVSQLRARLCWCMLRGVLLLETLFLLTLALLKHIKKMALGERVRTGGWWHCHITSLPILWYSLLVTSFHLLLCLRQLSVYNQLLTEPDQHQLQLVLIGISALLIPVFIGSAVLRLGGDSDVTATSGAPCWRGRQLAVTSSVNGHVINLSQLCRDSLPAAQLLHVFMAGLLMVSRALALAQLNKANLIQSESVWRSDLDTLFAPVNKNHSAEDANQNMRVPVQVSLEFVQFCLAAVALSYRYVQAVWHCRLNMALLFCFQLFLNAVYLISSLSAFCLLLRIHFASQQIPVHDRLVKDVVARFLLSPLMAACLQALSSSLVAISPCTLYLFGYRRWFSFVQRHRTVETVRDSPEGKDKVCCTCLRHNQLPQCAALCLLLAVGVANAPLLNDISSAHLAMGVVGGVTTSVALLAALLQHIGWLLLWLWLVARPECGFSVDVVVDSGRVVTDKTSLPVTVVRKMRYSPNAKKTAKDQLLVMTPAGTFCVDDETMTSQIISAADASSSFSGGVQRYPNHPDLQFHQVRERESLYESSERYVRLPERRQRHDHVASPSGQRLLSGHRSDSAYGRSVRTTGECSADLATSENRVQCRDKRVSLNASDKAAVVPLLHRPLPNYCQLPHHICPPPLCHQPLRRTCSQALPSASSVRVQRSSSLRHAKSRRSEARVAFNLQHTVLGATDEHNTLMTSAANDSLAVNHAHTNSSSANSVERTDLSTVSHAHTNTSSASSVRRTDLLSVSHAHTNSTSANSVGRTDSLTVSHAHTNSPSANSVGRTVSNAHIISPSTNSVGLTDLLAVSHAHINSPSTNSVGLTVSHAHINSPSANGVTEDSRDSAIYSISESGSAQ